MFKSISALKSHSRGKEELEGVEEMGDRVGWRFDKEHELIRAAGEGIIKF